MAISLKVGYTEQSGKLVAHVTEATGVTRNIFVTKYVPTSPLFADFRYQFCHVAYLEELTGFGEAPTSAVCYYRADKATIPLGSYTFAQLKAMMEDEVSRLLVEIGSTEASPSGSPDYQDIFFEESPVTYNGSPLTF